MSDLLGEGKINIFFFLYIAVKNYPPTSVTTFKIIFFFHHKYAVGNTVVSLSDLCKCYVTCIADLESLLVEFELDELMLDEDGELLMHFPVKWLTFNGFPRSCGFVPTGWRCGCTGVKNGTVIGRHGGGGGFVEGESYSRGCGVSGLCILKGLV